MNDEMQALARRAVACKHWKWTRGMLANGRRGVPTAWLRLEDGEQLSGEWANALPDLTDPATLGCLVALVREAWGDHEMFCFRVPRYYTGQDVTRWSILHGLEAETEAEAIVAALEHAP